MSSFVLHGGNFTEAITYLKKFDKNVKYHIEPIEMVGKRSLSQNAQIQVWYRQLARENKQEDEYGWRNFCKLHFGVDLLRRGDKGEIQPDTEFTALYDSCILNTLSYEEKLESMDVLPVTSRMNKQQFTVYIDRMRSHFLKEGIQLLFEDGT